MTPTVLGSHQLASLLFLLLAAPGTQLGARATTDCTSGFISLDRLRALSTRVRTRVPTQTVYPNINFTCNGVITKLTVLARRHTENNGTLYPEFQVWRRNNADGVYTRVGGTTLSDQAMNESDWEIYEHMLDLSLEFQAGDVFGMFRPQASRLLVAFEGSNGPESLTVNTGSAVVPPETFDSTKIFTDTLLVAITADPQECVRGSVSLERVEAVRSNLNGGRHNLDNRQSVSPQIKFTCDGNITKWIAGANNWDSDNDLYPELQVWRRANENIPNSYHRVGSITIAVAMENSDNYVYEYLVDPPLPVEAGDVLGIYQPQRSASRLRVLYERDSGPETLYQTPRSEEDFPEPAGETVRSHSSLPLVTVEIAPNPTSVVLSTPPSTSPVMNISVILKSISPISETPVPEPTVAMSTVFMSPVMSTFSISETPGGGVDMPASFPATAVGIGVAVGVVVAIATLAAVMIVVSIHKMRNNSSKDFTITGDAEEMKSTEACVKFPSISFIVENEAYGTAESAQPIKIHGNDAYQTAADSEAIAMEQNEAYDGRVEKIDHTHTITVEYEDILALHMEYVEIIK